MHYTCLKRTARICALALIESARESRNVYTCVQYRREAFHSPYLLLCVFFVFGFREVSRVLLFKCGKVRIRRRGLEVTAKWNQFANGFKHDIHR